MKKNIFRLLSLALVGTMFVGCEKEEANRLTFSFENMESPKSYIYTNNDGSYNCWEKEDVLHINGNPYDVIVSNGMNGNSAVSYVSNASALFDQDIFCFYGGNHNTFTGYNASTHQYTFTVPSEMEYTVVANGKQKTDAPVVGFLHLTHNNHRVALKNVGSMLKFSFNNGSTTKAIAITKIQIESYSNNIYLSGTATATASATPSAYSIAAPNVIAQEKKKAMTFGETGLSIPTTHDVVSVYFPIVSLSNAKIQILITATFHNQHILLRSPMFESVSIAQNHIMPLNTITIKGNGNQGEGDNPEIVINGNTYDTHTSSNENNTWRIETIQ